MSDDSDNENYMQFSLSRFMQPNNDNELDSVSSLSDFIKAHSSKSHVRPQSEDSSLSNLTLKHLNIKESKTEKHQISSSIDIPKTKKLIDLNHENSDTEDFNTLEEYTKSFLLSRGSSSVPTRRLQTHPKTSSTMSNFEGQKFKNSNSELNLVNDKISRMNISNDLNLSFTNSNSLNNWNVDLSVALSENDPKCSRNDVVVRPFQFESKIYTLQLHECILDLSSLIEEKLQYSNSVLSPFGYVLTRPGKKKHLAKKYRKIGMDWPYNKSLCFKFDSLSPDDIVLKQRTKIRTSSMNES